MIDAFDACNTTIVLWVICIRRTLRPNTPPTQTQGRSHQRTTVQYVPFLRILTSSHWQDLNQLKPWSKVCSGCDICRRAADTASTVRTGMIKQEAKENGEPSTSGRVNTQTNIRQSRSGMLGGIWSSAVPGISSIPGLASVGAVIAPAFSLSSSLLDIMNPCPAPMAPKVLVDSLSSVGKSLTEALVDRTNQVCPGCVHGATCSSMRVWCMVLGRAAVSQLPDHMRHTQTLTTALGAVGDADASHGWSVRGA